MTFIVDIDECVIEDVQCDSDTVCVNKNANYSCEGMILCSNC